MRLPFLVLTLAAVFLGAGIAGAANTAVDWSLLWLVLAGALLAHIAVNMLNEHHDFGSGLDLATNRTPFSGGSGALPRTPEAAAGVRAAAIAALLGTLTIGLYLLAIRGWELLLIGLPGIIVVLAYTPWITRHPLLCLIAPGTGVGFLMVPGTQYVLSGFHSPTAWLAAFVPFFLANNLLLLNQYPDIGPDAAAGRKQVPGVYGVRTANTIYGVSMFAAMLVILVGVVSTLFPVLSLAALLAVPLGFVALAGALRHGGSLGSHTGYLAANAAVAVLVPAMLGLSFLLAG